MGWFARTIELDRTLRTAYVTSSSAYSNYREFVKDFGNNEFILIALSNQGQNAESAFLSAVDTLTNDIEGMSEVSGALSITNLKFIQSRKGKIGSYRLLLTEGDKLHLPKGQQLEKARSALPFLDYLVSGDHQTLGIIVWLHDQHLFDPNFRTFLGKITNLAEAHLPPGSELRIVGGPVIREAVQNLTVRTTIIFGILAALVSCLLSLCIFKSFRAAAISMTVFSIAVVWNLGFMALMDIPLSATTALSLGLVLLVSVTTVIHIMTHYYSASASGASTVEAARAALKVIALPCLMCSMTTAVAFFTTTLSSIPMVKHLGMVMSAGVLGAFMVAIVMTPACLIALKPINSHTCERMAADWVVQALRRLRSFVFNRYRLCAISGLIFFIVMLAGFPFIGTDTDVLRLFVKSSRPLTDLHFVEDKLSSVHSVEVVIDAGESAFKRPDSWKKLSEVSDKLKEMSDIERIDFPLPLFEYVHSIVSKSGATRDELFDNPRLTNNLMMLIRSGSDGRKLLERYLDDRMGRVRMTCAIKNGNSTPIGTVIDRIKGVVNGMVEGWGKCLITGELAVYVANASHVVRSMVISLLVALFSITVLLILLFRSLPLGLLSLIPNLLPLATIFGLMGWAGVPLDNITVFVVAIAIGLSVDDTIHYLTQLRRSVLATEGSQVSFRRHLMNTHEKTARALTSTSILLACGSLMLCFTPSVPAVYFGLLAAAAILAALLGDLVVLPAIILAFPSIQELLYKHSSHTQWNPVDLKETSL